MFQVSSTKYVFNYNKLTKINSMKNRHFSYKYPNSPIFYKKRSLNICNKLFYFPLALL